MTEPYSMYSLLLDSTARKVKQYAQQRFKELSINLTVDQWLVMKQLYENESLNQKELADLLYKDTPTLTRIIDLLCDKGYTLRHPHPTDRRCFQVKLTDEGNDKVSKLIPEVKNIRLQAWQGLGEDDFNHFKKVLLSIQDNLS